MSDLTWAIKLVNQMGGPALAAAASLGKLDSALKHVDASAKKAEHGVSKAMTGTAAAADRATGAVDRVKHGLERWTEKLSPGQQAYFGKLWNWIGTTFGSRTTGMIAGAANQLTQWDDALGSVGLSLGGVVTAGAVGAAAALAAVAASVGLVVYKLGELAVRGAVAFANMAISTGVFRENTLLSLEVMLKSEAAAKRVYASAVDMAAKTPFETKDVVESYKKLLGYGFKEDELAPVFTAIGNMAAARADPAIISRLALVMGQIKAKGKLTGEELMQLTEAGMDQGALLDIIGKSMGKTRDEVSKLLSAGKISSEEAIKAIVAFSNERYGGMMDKMAGTLSGLWSTVVSRGFELFDEAFEGPGMKSFFDSVKGVAKWISEALNPKGDSGKRIVAILGQLGEAFGKLVGSFSEKDATAMLSKTLDVVEQLVPLLLSLGEGLFAGLAESLGPLAKDFLGSDSIDKSKRLAASLKVLGEAIGWVVGHLIRYTVMFAGFAGSIASFVTQAVAAVVAVISGVYGYFEFLVSVPGRVIAALGSLLGGIGSVAAQAFGAAVSIGVNLVAGIVSGIQSAASSVGSTLAGVVASAVAAASGPKGADSHSPSKKMARLGGYMSEGLAEGVRASSSSAHASLVEMVRPPTRSEVAPSSPARGGGSGVTVTVEAGAIQIQGGGDVASLEAAFAAIVERFAAQLGSYIPSTT